VNAPTLGSINALLNATCLALVIAGWRFVRAGRIEAHKKAMGAAFSVSILFLAGYLLNSFLHGNLKYQGEGTMRTVFFAVLIPHTIAAVIAGPAVVVAVLHGVKGRIDRHRRIVRWTLPLWIFVSATGVLVYVLLYWI